MRARPAAGVARPAQRWRAATAALLLAAPLALTASPVPAQQGTPAAAQGGASPAAQRTAPGTQETAPATQGDSAPGTQGDSLPRPQVGVAGDTIRVGDVVPVAVRVTVAPGQRVAWPDTLPLEGAETELENAARVRTRSDTLPDGRIQVTATYAVTPWRPGEAALPALELAVVSGDEEPRPLTATLPTLDVVSVLPADTAGIEPRPPRDVIGRNWAWWPWILLALALLAAIGVLIWWLRHRRGREVAEPVPAVPPRERALTELAAIRDAGLLDAGRTMEFYTRTSGVLRHYLAAIEPAWGEDLTTTELLARFRAGIGPTAATALGDVLRPMDQVKFARRTPDRDTALAEWEAARTWVEGFRWPPVTTARDETGGEVAA
ncbi:MAG TPA: DUF4381 family protein [Longimicrobiales bacterium]|nr:DUF4381 family protein [Longimicrobiales bacterium]